MPTSSAAPSGAGCAVALPILCTLLGLAHVAAKEDPAPKDPVPVIQGNLMTKEREKTFRGLMPKVNDKAMQTVFEDPNTFYYTETEMPKGHQDFDGSLHGTHDPANNISAVPKEPPGNGNVEFPWGRPFGTHPASTES